MFPTSCLKKSQNKIIFYSMLIFTQKIMKTTFREYTGNVNKFDKKQKLTI